LLGGRQGLRREGYAMKTALGLLPLLTAVFMALPEAATGSPATDAFNTACNANPDFFASAAEGLQSNPDGLRRLCSCLTTSFADYPEADITMLTHDVEGTATAEERTAYGDYTGLEMRAVDAVNACLVAEGLSSATDPVSPGGPADMAAFDQACHNSEGLLAVIGGTPAEAAPLRTTLCQCLTATLGPQISTDAARVLAMDLDGTATEVTRNAYPGYQELTQLAGTAFDGCFQTLHPAQ
jgi:hypothetical protein